MESLYCLGGSSLPFDSKTTTIVKRFLSTAAGKFYKIYKLRDLQVSWL